MSRKECRLESVKNKPCTEEIGDEAGGNGDAEGEVVGELPSFEVAVGGPEVGVVDHEAGNTAFLAEVETTADILLVVEGKAFQLFELDVEEVVVAAHGVAQLGVEAHLLEGVSYQPLVRLVHP